MYSCFAKNAGLITFLKYKQPNNKQQNGMSCVFKVYTCLIGTSSERNVKRQ